MRLAGRKPLSDAELRVLRGAAEGKSSAEQARELHRSQYTVKTHRKKILGKLGARNMVQAVALAYELGLLRKGAVEEEPTGPQTGAYKSMAGELAGLRGVDRTVVEREALAAASERLGRELVSHKDHTRRELYDTLDWLTDGIAAARLAVSA